MVYPKEIYLQTLCPGALSANEQALLVTLNNSSSPERPCESLDLPRPAANPRPDKKVTPVWGDTFSQILAIFKNIFQPGCRTGLGAWDSCSS